jgi:hypothetical protein
MNISYFLDRFIFDQYERTFMEKNWKLKIPGKVKIIYMENAKEYCAENGKAPKKTYQGK